MSKSSFERWVGGQESKWSRLKRELYSVEPSVNGDGSSLGAVVPTGLIALWNLMTSSRNDLVGPSRHLVAEELGERLGFGLFATIHATTRDREQIIKVSRYGSGVRCDSRTLTGSMCPFKIAGRQVLGEGWTLQAD
jgi:hypothetical protein